MENSYFTNNSLFNFLPQYYGVKGIETKDDLYTMAHNIVIISTETASKLTEYEFEDFDEEREEAIEFVMTKIIEQNENLKHLNDED